jgi:hypothetical protein
MGDFPETVPAEIDTVFAYQALLAAATFAFVCTAPEILLGLYHYATSTA